MGSATITASQVGNTNYNPASNVARIFNITLPTRVQSSINVTEINIYPNPNKSGVFEISGLLNVDKTKVDYSVSDASGKVIRQGIWAGKDMEILDLSKSLGGTYILLLQGNKIQISKKIVKQ